MIQSRSVPPALVVHCLFGGGLGTTAWIMLFVGAFLLRFIVLNTNPLEPFLFASAERTTGTVTATEDSGVREGGGKHSSGSPIIGYRFDFETPSGKRSGFSYISGSSFEIGDTVDVEYTSASARILNGRTAMLPWGLGIPFAIEPLVGLLLALLKIRQGLGAIRLLKNGVLTRGKLIREQPTGVIVNNRPVVEYVFEFKTRSGVRTEVSARTSLPERVLDEKEESILYDEADPAKGLVVDALPGKATFDPTGNLVAPGMPLFHLGLTALTVATYVSLFRNYFPE